MYSFAFGRSSVFDINSLVDVACVARFTAARPAVGFNFAFFCYCSQQNKSKSLFFLLLSSVFLGFFPQFLDPINVAASFRNAKQNARYNVK